ncbi:hypothetical protein SAMN05428947_105278 [Mucilaginibacter sp. OK283]|nr:hypothetical protein SAMN05428947_105278 [Mucilaginibacter sp. OK283]
MYPLRNINGIKNPDFTLYDLAMEKKLGTTGNVFVKVAVIHVNDYLLKPRQMKVLSKLIAVSIIASAIFFTTNAQAQTVAAKQFTFSLGAETGLPTGISRKGSSFVLGATGQFQYGITNNFAATFAAGGYHFFSKTNPNTGKKFDSYGEIPVKIGVKQFFMPNLYVGVEGGLAWEKLEDGQGWAPFHRRDLAGRIGYANKHWDLSARYEDFYMKDYHTGLVALRLAYGFGL